MSIRSLLDRARGLLGPKPPAGQTTAVEHDRYDARLVRDLRNQAPKLEAMAQSLREDVDYANEIVQDTVLQLWQADPKVRDADAMETAHLHVHGVATDLANSRELDEARRYTVHDEYGSAMAAISVTERIREFAHQHRERLQDDQEALEEAIANRNSAEDALQEDLEQVEQQLQDAPWLNDEYHGPLTDEQQQARDDAASTLVQAVEATQVAQTDAADAASDYAAGAALAQQELQRSVDQALQQAAENLKEEAALFRTWGAGPGELERMSFEERAAMAERLRNNALSEYIDFIGRFKLMAAAQRVRKVEYGRDQIVGVELSGDLSRVTPTELMNFAMGDDELGEMYYLDFLRRWMEEQLLSYEYNGEERVGKGAIIAVVDNSTSMKDKFGNLPKEMWAKGFVLALLDQAQRQKRDFVGINFSWEQSITVRHFLGGKVPIHELVEYIEEFLGGGTHFERPLGYAVDALETEFNRNGKAKGDIVFITDGQANVSPGYLANHQKRQAKLAFRTFGIQIGSDSTRTLEAFCDNVRRIEELADPALVQDIFQIL